MKRNTANLITGLRILGSIVLVFVPAFSARFYAVYLICGLSDIADGAAARKTECSSPFGARLDTTADFLFTLTVLAKLLPRIRAPWWLWLWTAAIALIKVFNAVSGYIRDGKLPSVHSAVNRAAGLLLFLFPLTLGLVELRYSAAVVCPTAALAALEEGRLIRTGRTLVTDRKSGADVNMPAPRIIRSGHPDDGSGCRTE